MTYQAEKSEDFEEIAGILAAAFAEDPVIGWALPPGLPGRERCIAGFMCAWVRFMVEHEGTALVSPRDAVLVWEPSERAPVPAEDHEAFRADISASTGPAAERCLALIDILDARYPPGLPPHLHGALAAARPGARSRGAFLLLAAEMLVQLYHGELGLYVEASSDSSSALWQRLGTSPIGPTIPLPDSDAVVTPLFLSPDGVARHPALPVALSLPSARTA
ncbi:hypothetical protein AB0G73_00165 [Streptomyces sp. NPDC020719]|uniref:hypothetical protein n=1 Tax=Streptomyces sp. NPDC020719 TaxID=3154896 RepID=UPI0033D7AD67